MSANEQKADGKLDRLKGKAKEAWADLTGNESLKAEGQAEQAKGSVKEGVADARKSVADVVEGRG